MKRHTLVCPPGFVEQFGKCVPEGNRPDGTRADLVSGDVVPFVPDNVPDGGGGGDDGYDYGGLFDKASKALRYAGMSKKIYDSQQSLEEEMRRYQLGAGEAEEGTEVIMFRGPEEAPLTTEELRLRALAKQYDDVPMEPTKSKTQIKYEEDLDRILKRPNAPPDTPPTQEEIDKIIKARKKTTFIPSEDPDAKLLNEIAERQAAPVDEGIPADIPTLESLSGNKSGVGKNPFPDPAGQYGGVRPPLDELPPDVPSRPPTFAPLDELPPDVPSVEPMSSNPFVSPSPDPVAPVKGGTVEYPGYTPKKFFPDKGMPTDIPPPELDDAVVRAVGADLNEAIVDAAKVGAGVGEGLTAGGVGLIIAGLDGTGNYGVDVGLVSGGTTALVAGAVAAPETLGLSLVAGGLMYGVQKGAEALFDVGANADQKYHKQQNEELGTHQMDEREVNYKLKELGSVKKHYEEQVKYHNFGDNPRSQKQHAQDKAMLAAVTASIESLRSSKFDGEPVYAIVNENSEATTFVNKASPQELEQGKQAYIQSGGEAFGNASADALRVMGYADAIGNDTVQTARIKVEESQKSNTDSVAASQGLKVGGGSVA